MDTLLVASDVARYKLTCLCSNCQAPNAPYEVLYLYGDLILMNAICAGCGSHFWRKWDLLKLQMIQDEKEVEQVKAAMDELSHGSSSGKV